MWHIRLSICIPELHSHADVIVHSIQEKKEESYDKSPYTHRKIHEATWQHKNAIIKKFDYKHECGPT